MSHVQCNPLYLLPCVLDCLIQRLKEKQVVVSRTPIDVEIPVHSANVTIPSDARLLSNAQIIEEYIQPWVDALILRAKFGQHPLLPSRIRFKRLETGNDAISHCTEASGVVVYAGLDVIRGDIHIRSDFQVVAQ